MKTTNFQNTEFLISAANIKQFPTDKGVEIAFIGLSNVGKSSALNRLTNQKHLARTSKTPGRTQLINFFSLNNNKRLVDLPGYGYAKVPEKIKQRWQLLIDQYLRNRKSLKGLVLLMDIRHPLKAFEQQMIQWVLQNNIQMHILLTKADKISQNVRLKTLVQVKNKLQELIGHPVQGLDGIQPAGMQNQTTTQFFSSTKSIGIDELKNKLDLWFSQATHD